MTTSTPSSTRRLGAARILSLLLLAGCSAGTLTEPPFPGPFAAAGGGSGPTIRAADPDTGFRNTTIDVRVLGSGFDNGSKATWALAGDTTFATTNVKTNSTRFVKSGELVANITIGATAPLALFDVVVVTSSGRKGIGIEKFTVKLVGQTSYGITFQQGIESDPAHPFFSPAKTGDPFGIGGAVTGSVYLSFPAGGGGVTAVCDADGSGLGATTASWGAYGGIWTGGIKASQGHVSFVATRENGSGYLNLVVRTAAVSSNGNLTITFTNVRGLVAANSTPNGGPKDPQDRCLTFSITATP